MSDLYATFPDFNDYDDKSIFMAVIGYLGDDAVPICMNDRSRSYGLCHRWRSWYNGDAYEPQEVILRPTR